MFLDRPTVLRPRALPGMPAGSEVLRVPFADVVATALGVRAVALARRAGGGRLVIAVCEGCRSCELFGTALAAAATPHDIRLTMLYPRHGGGRTGPGGPGGAGSGGGWGAGVGWPQWFLLADLEPFAGSYAGAVRASRERARQLAGAVDGNVPGPAGNHGQYALAVHLVEALSVLPDPPATIWLPYDPATCAALDSAVRLLGWPSTLAAVAATPQPDGWPTSALDPYLCPRDTDADRVEPLDPDPRARAIARQILADAAMPSGQARSGDGLAGLLTAHRTGRQVSGDLVLVPVPSLADMYGDAS
ncbi:hypothetical protein [Dactylosporangium salmoneum]|uniref:Uncharacterized protein n=1 Tax=Dactylosporangium salmoneum TaxID=53361 RepID=A0ABN3G0Y1_9ACTN